jgi:LDH2 family malate/lactate/ureidoglycolate dehydrogenase
MIRHKRPRPLTATLKLAAAFAALALSTAPSALAAPREITVDQAGSIPADVRMKVVSPRASKIDSSVAVVFRMRCSDLPEFSCNGTVLVLAPPPVWLVRE